MDLFEWINQKNWLEATIVLVMTFNECIESKVKPTQVDQHMHVVKHLTCFLFPNMTLPKYIFIIKIVFR